MLDITKDIQSLTTFRRSSGDFMKCKIITKRARQRMLPSFPEKKSGQVLVRTLKRQKPKPDAVEA